MLSLPLLTLVVFGRDLHDTRNYEQRDRKPANYLEQVRFYGVIERIASHEGHRSQHAKNSQDASQTPYTSRAKNTRVDLRGRVVVVRDSGKWC